MDVSWQDQMQDQDQEMESHRGGTPPSIGGTPPSLKSSAEDLLGGKNFPPNNKIRLYKHFLYSLSSSKSKSSNNLEGKLQIL